MSSALIPPHARGVIERWLSHHDELAPGVIEGLYLVGSIALDDWQPRSDIDIIAFTADPMTGKDAEALLAAHVAAAADTPATPIDGPRLAWGDVTVPPTSLHRPWTLGGEYHHDGECFEINPITWYVLATSGVAVRGPDPAQLEIADDATARLSFVRQNVDTYWRSVAESATAAAADPARTSFDASLIEWCVLGVARMLYTFRTADVVSKSAAGAWLASELPQHRPVVDHALSIRRATTAATCDDRAIVAAAAELARHVVELITAS